MQSNQSELSLRERNRVETWNAVHDAASSIALDDGLAAATIEAIAARAGISRRTFFNYFPTKEDAILGTQPPVVGDDAIERFRASGDDLLVRTVNLLASVLSTSFVSGSMARRRVVVKARPELRERVIQHVSDAEELVTQVLHERIADGVDGSAIDTLPDPEQSPRALIMLAGVITKFAFSNFQDAGRGDLEPHLADSIATFRKVVEATR
ncbi:TetR family transcriptional regulator [Zhihengliuella salsuginis]|uniref:Transcriptional regulator n=1 Tax=Zhihengliuella salsuginis TaxID=578222 RepID=A0ABQ3GGH2_9MICC|nr:TetR family transcriptional regulator [Zhihengliuella salsuginis]GHD05215.1 transcriptional regulator [Zhihengliuella salsuginis]